MDANQNLEDNPIIDENEIVEILVDEGNEIEERNRVLRENEMVDEIQLFEENQIVEQIRIMEQNQVMEEIENPEIQEVRVHDPFVKVPPEFRCIILERMSIKDLLRSSLVSKYWYRTIAETDIFLNRLLLVFDWNTECTPTEEDIEILMRSHRRLRNFKLDWTVTLATKHVMRATMALINRFSDTLVDLSVAGVDLTNHRFQFMGLPRLKYLELNCNSSNLDGLFMRSSTGIEKLSLMVATDEIQEEAFAICLSDNILLKDLTLEMEYAENLFHGEFVVKFKFNLTTFSVNNKYVKNQKCFVNFLHSQRHSIKTLYLGSTNCALINYVFQMPALKTFKFDTSKFEQPKLDLIINPRITELWLSLDLICSQMPYLIAAPNVEILHISSILVYEKLLDYIALNMKRLRVLVVEMKTAFNPCPDESADNEKYQSILDYYDYIRDQHPEYNQNIQILDDETTLRQFRNSL